MILEEMLFDKNIQHLYRKKNMAPHIPEPMSQKTVQPGSTSSSTDISRLSDIANNLQKKLPSNSRFSGVIALRSGDGPIVQASYCPDEAQFDSNHSFNVLSIGKLFTAVAAMQLIEDKVWIGGKQEQIDGREVMVGGKPLSLDTPLSDLLTPEELHLVLDPPYKKEKPSEIALAELSKHTQEITLRNLLSHSAGFVKRPEKGEIPSGEEWSEAAIGQRGYSNYGYQLLAIIIGKHSKNGNPENPEAGFTNHIKTRIFAPAGMAGAIEELSNPSTITDPARFEVLENGLMKKVDEPQPYPHGNGCWRMPASDLLLFAQAMDHDRLIQNPSYQKMLGDPPLGFMVEKGKFFGHPGHGDGQSANLCTYSINTNPPSTITAVVLSNYSNGADEVHALLEHEFGQ